MRSCCAWQHARPLCLQVLLLVVRSAVPCLCLTLSWCQLSSTEDRLTPSDNRREEGHFCCTEVLALQQPHLPVR